MPGPPRNRRGVPLYSCGSEVCCWARERKPPNHIRRDHPVWAGEGAANTLIFLSVSVVYAGSLGRMQHEAHCDLQGSDTFA